MTLDLCPTSNGQAGIVAVGRGPPARPPPPARRPGDALDRRHDGVRHHPDRGVRAGLGRIGLSLAELWAIDRHALDAAFATEADLAPVRAAFDAFEPLIRSG